MIEASRYRLNEPTVISEVIEGEAIILNFERGSYYNLNSSARAIWEDLIAGLAPARITERQATRFGLEPDQLGEDVSGLVKQLLSEQLIVPAESGTTEEPPIQPAGSEYLKPEMEKFTDLQELLLLDPIHEVDETGRPLGPA
jgi:hypothetical protein